MLLEMQRSWTASVLDPEQLDDAALNRWRGGQRSADEGFAVYVNNVRANIIDALTQSFPATRALAGDTAMQRAALHCLRHAPPRCGDLGVYGAALIDEIAYWVTDDEREAIREVARYEWTVDQLARKPREPAWSLQSAAHIPPQRWPTLCLHLVEHSCVFESAVPVRAWRAYALEGSPLPVDAAECVLLLADDSDVQSIELLPAERIFLRELSLHRNLEAATQSALTYDASLALPPLLARLLSVGAITALPS